MASMQGEDNYGYQVEGDEGGENRLYRSHSFDDLRISDNKAECNESWDRFEKKKTKIISWSSRNTMFKTTRDIICKVFTIFLFFWIMLFLIVTSKVSILSLTSRLGPTKNSGSIPRIDVRWIWATLLCITTPYGITFLLSCWKLLIKKKESCKCLPTLACVGTEFLHSIGILLLGFLVLPNLQPILGCLLMSAVGLVPSVMRVLVEWDTKCQRPLCNIINICAAVAYVAVLIVWCFVLHDPSFTIVTVCLPTSVVLISLKWWDNFAESSENNEQTCHVCLISKSSETTKHIALKDLVVSLVKGFTTILGTIIVYGYGENDKCIRTLFFLANGASKCTVFGTSLQLTSRVSDVDEACYANFPFLIAGFAICSCLVCYIISVASCKALIQVQCFSMPIFMSTPATFGVLLLLYYYESALFPTCVFKEVMMSDDAWNAVSGIETPIWICGCLSWILFSLVSGHIWVPCEEKMAKRERLDLDCYARRKHNVSSYHLEANIFVDDAFVESEDSNIRQINSWSKQLIRVVRDTHLFLREKQPRLGEPDEPDCYETPYGGKIVWKLPGETTLSAHLKDKTKIRNKKRWSQVMYMYYLLGFRMSSNTEHNKKKNRSTFLLALDGDVDFQEEALKKLIDRMLRDPDVGAACGRIHPVGTGMGPILWYQKFEYAVSHWLQKAAEHVTGCVLCSPGCFSLYRATALMDKDVIRKYATPSTQSKHFVQYDQGEDRWLCTLLLQRGHRIEYCASSDSYTFAPEGFGEFFNQRKRWSPSTMSNTVDLLMNWCHLTKKNNTISSLFLVYQTALMLCLLFTPGTIFLLILGAVHLAFPAIPTYGALILNLIPVAAFIIICLNTETKTQVKVAGVLCILYILSMMVVLVGLLLQAVLHGICSATTLFLISLFGIFFTTALLHPQEFTCIFAGIVYFFFTPTMSMLLVIYSVCNLNNISWGTRENKMGAEPYNGAGKNDNQGRQLQQAWSRLTNSGGFVRSLRRCFCFPPDETNGKILGKLDKLEKMVEQSQIQGATVATPVPEEAQRIHWTEDKCFRVKRELSEKEETFWKGLVETYLKPKSEANLSQEDIKNDLKELRNRVCLLFLVANSLLVVLVVTLQMNPDINIHLPCASARFENEDFEPISVTFMVVFGILLVIQFFAMLFHRAGTFLHILSTTAIPNPFKCKKGKKTTPGVGEDEPDGRYGNAEEDERNIDGEDEVRIFKYLLLHDMKNQNSGIGEGRSDRTDDDIPRFERIRMRLCSDLSNIENDSTPTQNISDIVKKTKTTEKCVKRFLERVKSGKTEHRTELNQTNAESADQSDESSFHHVVNTRTEHRRDFNQTTPKTAYQSDESSFHQVVNTRTSPTPRSMDEVDGQNMYVFGPKRKVPQMERKHVKGANPNQRIRPILKNKVSPRSFSLVNETQTVAVVHTPSGSPEVNIDDLTNETKL